jgi:hypothetical protein
MPGMRPRETGLRVLASFLLFLVAVFLVGVAGAVSAQPLTVSGVAGYLSEWQLIGSVTETAGGEFTGPLAIKHIGLCSHDGPQEEVTEIRLRTTGFDPRSRVPVPWSQVSFIMEGVTCAFGGRFSGTYTGFMDCAGAKGVPVTLSVK